MLENSRRVWYNIIVIFHKLIAVSHIIKYKYKESFIEQDS